MLYSRYGVTIRRQMSYIACFPNQMDQHPIISLGRQIRPGRPFWLLRCFELLAQEEKESSLNYIFFDAHPDSLVDKSLQVRTKIFDEYPYFFVINETS